jgi:flagellar assembly protein FliH
MDQRRHDGGRLRPAAALTPRPLRAIGFDPPTVVETRPTRMTEAHARRLAAALAEAREEGLRQARQEVDLAIAGHRAAQQRFERAADALSAAVEQLRAQDHDELADLERCVVELAFDVAEQLVGRELATADEQLRAAIGRAASLVPERGAIELRINPADAALASTVADARPELSGRVRVTPDDAIAAGGCVAVVGALRIDAQLAPAVQRVRAALAG